MIHNLLYRVSAGGQELVFVYLKGSRKAAFFVVL